ncbi:MAG: hypothetical protein J07HQX50_01665 [Haloquadratum sp. J07HQX50]|nr:MAG: hypothetical protein J07HQX50_01665 [Haloquadratum sp. J07HQX50]
MSNSIEQSLKPHSLELVQKHLVSRLAQSVLLQVVFYKPRGWIQIYTHRADAKMGS